MASDSNEAQPIAGESSMTAGVQAKETTAGKLTTGSQAGEQIIDGLSPGESTTLNYFSILNTGTADAIGLNSVISSDRPELTFRTERLIFPPDSSHEYVNETNHQDNSERICLTGESYGQETNIYFTISDRATPGQVINLMITVTDDFQNVYRLEYPLEVQ